MQHGHGAGSLGEPAQSRTNGAGAGTSRRKGCINAGVGRRSRSRLLLGVEQNKVNELEKSESSLMKRVLKEVDGSGWLGAMGIWWALYIYLWTC